MWYEITVSSNVTVAVEAVDVDQAIILAKEKVCGNSKAADLFTESSRLEADSYEEIDESMSMYSDLIV